MAQSSYLCTEAEQLNTLLTGAGRHRDAASHTWANCAAQQIARADVNAVGSTSVVSSSQNSCQFRDLSTCGIKTGSKV